MAGYFGHTKTFRFRNIETELRPPTSLGELGPLRSSSPFRGTPAPGQRYTKSIDLAPGEYSRISPASEAMQEYFRYSRYMRNYGVLRRFGSMTGSFIPAVLAVGAVEGINYLYSLGDSPGPANLDPVGYTKIWDAGPHAASVVGHVNESDRWGYVSTGAVDSFHAPVNLHGQALTAFGGPGATNPVPATPPQFMISVTGDRLPPNPSRWYVRAHYHRIGSTAPWSTTKGPRIGRALPFPDAPPYAEIKERSYPRPRPRVRWRTYNAEQVMLQHSFPPNKPPKTEVGHPPVPRPPSTNVRERKFKLLTGLPGKIFGALTEIDDFANCMAATTWAWKKRDYTGKKTGGKRHGNEAKLVRPCRGKTGLAKAKCLAQYADYTNPHALAELIKCVALTNLSDLAIGRANRAANRQYFRAYEGLGVSPRNQPGRGISIKRPPAPPPFGTPTRMHSF